MKTQDTKICGMVINQELERKLQSKISILKNKKGLKSTTSGTRKRRANVGS